MREIRGTLYRVTFGETGNTRVFEADSMEELIKYVFDIERRWFVSNVVELEIGSDRIRTPKIAIKSHPYYKQLMQEYRKNNKN